MQERRIKRAFWNIQLQHQAQQWYCNLSHVICLVLYNKTSWLLNSWQREGEYGAMQDRWWMVCKLWHVLFLILFPQFLAWTQVSLNRTLFGLSSLAWCSSGWHRSQCILEPYSASSQSLRSTTLRCTLFGWASNILSLRKKNCLWVCSRPNAKIDCNKILHTRFVR